MMSSRPLIIAALLGFVGAFLWLAWSQRDLRRELAETQRQLQLARQTVPVSPRDSDAHTTPTDKNQEIPANMPSPTVAVVHSIPPGVDRTELAAKQLDLAIIQVEHTYGRFFSRLPGWTPERIEQLKLQFANHNIARLRLIMPGGLPVSEAEMQNLAGELTRLDMEKEQQLRSQLGPEAYEQLEKYEKSRAYRATVDDLANGMRAKGVAVDERMEEVILNAYATATRLSAEKIMGIDSSGLTAEQTRRVETLRRRELQIELMRQVAGVLDEKQTNLLIESLMERHHDQEI